jgi:hypothetical protein
MFSGPVSAQGKAETSDTAGPRHEVGVDLEASYTGFTGGGGLVVGLPADVRFAFLTRKAVMWELRVSAMLNTYLYTSYLIVPGLNVLYRLNRGTGPHNLLGAPYITAGVGLSKLSVGGEGGTLWLVNGGVGTRVPFGPAATRIEGFFRYGFTDGRSNYAVGARIGWSFWH